VKQVRGLNAQELRAWVTFVTASALLDRVLDQQLRADAGLSHTQYAILARLSEAPDGSMRMLALADAMFITKSTLTYQIAQLEKDGVVSRRACETDDRGVIASITPQGMDLLRRAAPGHVALVRELVIDAFTPQQLAVLADGFAEVQRRIIEHQV